MNLIIQLLACLPLKLLQLLGKGLGLLAYWFSSRYRHILKTNLSQAGQYAGFNANARLAAMNAGLLFVDTIWIWRNREKAISMTKVKNWHFIDDAMKQGKGMLILGMHLGAFEILPIFFGQYYPATVLYRPAKQAWLDKVLKKNRAHPGMTYAPANLQGMRAIARALKNNEVVAMMPDQAPGVGDGVWAKYFGRYAYTPVLPAKIIQKGNIPTVMMVVTRTCLGKGWQIEVLAPEEKFSDDPQLATEQLNRLLEKSILTNPHQYLWGYNRYKHPAGAQLPPAAN